MSSLFSPSSLMIAETLAIPVKFNHICFCQWRPATHCQEFTTPLFSSVTYSLLCKANVISGSVSILTSPFWLFPWLCWHCFTDMVAELTRRFGKSPPTQPNLKCGCPVCWFSTFLNQRPPTVQHNIQRPETGNVNHHNSFCDSKTVK